MSIGGLGSLPALFLYDTEVKNQKTPLATTAKDPKVQADITYFTKTVASLKSVNDFLNNPKLVNFALTAFGLQSESSAMGIVKQVLTQDPTAKHSLANQLADPRWQQLAQAFDFYHRGLNGLQSYTSNTSAAIQSGSVTLTLNTVPKFKVGQTVTFADSANPHTNFLVGSVSAINGSSVTLSVANGIGAIGSGTINKWTVYANNPKSGGTTTLPSQVMTNITQKYITAQYENNLGQQSTPVEEAAYFLRNIGNITNMYSLLADPVLTDVVEGAYGIPKSIAVQPIEDQAKLLSSQLNLKTMQTPNASAFASANTDQTALQGVQQVASAAQSALTNVVNQITTIQQQYSFLAGETDPAGSNAAKIAVQQAAVPALAQASGLIGAANVGLNNIQTSIASLNALVAAAPTADAATLATDKAQFQILTQQIQSALAGSTYVSPTDGSTGNLLTDGSLSVSATVKAGETVTFTGLGLNASSLNSQLSAANTAFQSMSLGGSVDPSVASTLSSVGGTFTTAQTQVTAQQKSWNQAVQDSGTFVAALHSGALNAGLGAGQDAQSRLVQVTSLLGQLQTLATQSADPTFSGDRTALNTQATSLISQINTAVSTPGTGISDNLLTSTSKSYALIGSSNITIRGAGLDTSVVANLTSADISTASGAQSLSNLIANTIQPAAQEAQLKLSSDVTAMQTTINSFDPRAPIDAQLKQLVASLPGIETAAGVNGKNLISTSATSLGITLKTTGDTFQIHPHAEFDSQVTGVLQQAITALSTSDGPPSSLVTQALANASSIQIAIRGDVNAMTPDVTKINGLVAQQAKQTAANQTNPYAGATAAAQSLVQRYLALYDANNQTGPNSYLTTLLGIGDQPSVIDISLSNLNLTT